MDRNYKATTKEIGHTIHQECKDDLRHFHLINQGPGGLGIFQRT